jgi:hypothetical protein
MHVGPSPHAHCPALPRASWGPQVSSQADRPPASRGDGAGYRASAGHFGRTRLRHSGGLFLRDRGRCIGAMAVE